MSMRLVAVSWDCLNNQACPNYQCEQSVVVCIDKIAIILLLKFNFPSTNVNVSRLIAPWLFQLIAPYLLQRILTALSKYTLLCLYIH